MAYVKKRRNIFKKISLWFNAFFKLYKLTDRFAEADDRYWTISERLRTMEQESRAWRSQALDQLDALRARLDAVDVRCGSIETRCGSIESQQAKSEAQIAVVESQFDGFEVRFDDKLLFSRKQEFDERQLVLRQIGDLRREIMFQQRRLTQLVAPIDRSLTHDVAKCDLLRQERLDSYHVAFEELFRGSRADIKSRLGVYVDILRAAGAGNLGLPVVDIGCGRGEWLELLRENNIPAYGLDRNSFMAQRAASFGVDVRVGDVIEHLRGLDASSLSAVTAFHVVEHLPFETVMDFLDEALRVIAPGGAIILETPNPETMRVGATTFYDDPTRRNPIPPVVLQFMLSHRGFDDPEILRLHPFADGLLTQPTDDARLLNQVLFGPQDYAVVARRL